MKKLLLTALASVFIAGCAFISPYTITFTTPEGSVIDPATSTVDLVINSDALAYISVFKCDDNDAVELLPIVSEEMMTSKVHNLSLEMLSGQVAGAKCKVTVTSFDRTTTANSGESITLYVLEKPEGEDEVVIEEEVVEEELVNQEEAAIIAACSEQGGTWNECGSACDESAELCIQVCVPQCEFPDESVTETSELTTTEE